ncbi:hypothetical protein TNCT_314381, partial [Trichonephila clavata]
EHKVKLHEDGRKFDSMCITNGDIFKVGMNK